MTLKRTFRPDNDARTGSGPAPAVATASANDHLESFQRLHADHAAAFERSRALLAPAAELAEGVISTLRSGGNDQWIRQVVRAPESSRRFTASVAVQMNAPAGLAVGRETAYVDDYNVEIAQAATIADPAIETVFGGLSLRLLAQPSGKEGRTSLAFEVVMTTMAPEIGTFQTGTVDSGRMQQPAVERFQNTGITAIDDKEYGLLAEFSSAAAPDEVLLVVAQVQPLGSGK